MTQLYSEALVLSRKVDMNWLNFLESRHAAPQRSGAAPGGRAISPRERE